MSVDAGLVKDEVRDASEAQRLELMLVTVGLEDLSNFFDGQLVIVRLLIEWPQLVQLAIRGCEVDSDSHVDVPTCLEVIHETRLLEDLELRELDEACSFHFCFLVDQFSFFVRFLIQNFLGRDFTRSVEQVAAISLPRV